MEFQKRIDILTKIFIFLIISISCLPLFKNIHNINLHRDWLQILSYYRSDLTTLLEYHQIPLRTFYFGGGYPLIANPQNGFLSPFFIPVLIFGEVIGMKINVFLGHIIASFGMYYLVRCVLKYNRLGALFSVFVFCFGGFLHRILVRGQAYISPLYTFFTPLILAFFLKSRESRKYLFYTVLALAVVITQAGLYSLSLLVFLFLFSCTELFNYSSGKLKLNTGYFTNFFVIIVFVLLLCAVKVLPMAELVWQNPRLAGEYAVYCAKEELPLAIYKTFMTHQVSLFDPWHWRYFYVGYLPVFLSGLSFIMFWKKTKKYFFLLAVFILLSFGARTPFDLFRLFSGLPFFSSIYHPVIYFVPFVVFILAIASGQFFLITEKIKNKKFINFALIILVIFTLIDLLKVNTAKEDAFPYKMPQDKAGPSFFYTQNLYPNYQFGQAIGKIPILRSWETTWPSQYELMLQNIGKINWYGNIHLGEYAVPKYYVEWNQENTLDPEAYTWHLNPDYKGEIYFLDNPENRAEFSYFSPNKIIAKVNVIAPDTLVINQNFDKYWKAYPAKPINHNGLLAVKLDKPGSYEVKFNYWPVSFYLGLAVSLGTLVFIIKKCAGSVG